MRIDKYLWCVRLAKTRSLAADWIGKGRVRINGQPVKSSREVKHNDTIDILKNNAVFQYKVKGIIDRRIGAPLVAEFLLDITSEEEIQKFKDYQAAQRVYRNFGEGKPTKKDRRSIDDFLDNWEED